MPSSEPPSASLARLEARFWGWSPLWRRPARRLRLALSILLYRWRSLRRPLPPRVVSKPVRSSEGRAVRVTFVGPESSQGGHSEFFRTGNSEIGDPGAGERGATHLLVTDGEIPPIVGEALTLAAAAEDLELVIAGFGQPAGDDGPGGWLRPLGGGEARLLRRNRGGGAPKVVGRLLPMIAAAGEAGEIQAWQPLRQSGAYLLRPDVRDGEILRRPTYDVAAALSHLPASEGPPAVLFLLPFLAVGGAERLLFDLLAGFGDGCRCLVVTLEPHRRSLGQTVDRCRRLTPQVYTLGDWLPRTAVFSAVEHLVRRWRVRTLVSWNGTIDFFDRAAELRRGFPELRILSQLYHDRGGFTARTSPAVIAAVDTHLAVNRDIVRALEARAVPVHRIALIHHGVAVPEPAAEATRDRRRQERRRQLGLPEDAVLVVGSFIRLHPQKRPFDILALARRLSRDRIFFLLVGGGPMAAELDAELDRSPIENLLRLPMTAEPLPLYDALDVCLMTSSYEGLPVFLLDGLARGLPGVAPAVGDIPLLFADGGGLLAPRPGQLGSLEAALRSLVPEAERRRRGELGRRTVAEKFGLERYRDAYSRQIFPREADP